MRHRQATSSRGIILGNFSRRMIMMMNRLHNREISKDIIEKRYIIYMKKISRIYKTRMMGTTHFVTTEY